MYIQIDKNVRDSLQRNVIAKMHMGSHAHGLADDKSDEDILYVYYDMNYGHNVFNETNGWQYKNGNVDENYQELRVFIRNLITAKMCGNLEALLDGWEFTNDDLGVECKYTLELLFKRLRDIRSYALIKSYLGYTKKDIKNARKMLKEGCPLESRDLRKKLTHIMRGIDTVTYLLGYDKYSFTRRSLKMTKYYALRVKRGEVELDREMVNGILDGFEESMRDMREDAGDRLECKVCYRRGNPDHLDSINQLLNAFILNIDEEFELIEYDEELRLDILEKGESHQYQ